MLHREASGPDRFIGWTGPRRTAEVTATTAAAHGKPQRSAAPKGTRMLRSDLAYVRPVKRKVEGQSRVPVAAADTAGKLL